MMRSIAAGFVLTFFALVSPVSSGASEGQLALAPPGPCAEPRSAAGSGVSDGFAVAGPVSSLFDPNDVAAGPLENTERGQGPPDRRALVRPGSCDQPGSGCGTVLPKRTEVVVPPIDPGVRPPRASR